MPTQTGFGMALRGLRRRQDLTLAELSRRSGIAASTLSRVENARTSLTYVNLLRLAEGLGVEMAQLLAPEAALSEQQPVTARRSVDRGGGEPMMTKNYEYIYLNTDLAPKTMIPALLHHSARSLEEFGEMHRHPGEEFLLVMSGTLDVYTEFYQPARLESGHSMYIDGTMGHAYIAVGPEPCRSLCVMTVPESAGARGQSAIESSLAALSVSLVTRREAKRTGTTVAPAKSARRKRRR